MAGRGGSRNRSRSRSPHGCTYLSTQVFPLAIAQEPASHNQVMWLVKDEYTYWGASWYREAVRFQVQLEEHYQKGIGIEHAQLTWPSHDGNDVVTHYYTHDLSKKPWTQTRFWDANRERVKSSKEIVRVLK